MDGLYISGRECSYLANVRGGVVADHGSAPKLSHAVVNRVGGFCGLPPIFLRILGGRTRTRVGRCEWGWI